MLSTSPGKIYPPINRPIPPKIAIGLNPPLLRIFKNLQPPPPPNPGGVPTMLENKTFFI